MRSALKGIFIVLGTIHHTAGESGDYQANTDSTASDSRKEYYWKLWLKLIFGCLALVLACCKCCRQCQKGSDDDDDDDVVKNERELKILCDLCKEECLNPWHTHDFYCKAIKSSSSVGTSLERLNVPLSDLKCPKCIHGYLGLRPPDVIPIDARFKFVCDLKEKVPENHVRLMNLVEGNEEKNQFTCMNCMCNLCLRCVRDMKLRNRPLKIVQWFHLGDESRLFNNFRRSGVPIKEPAPPPNFRYEPSSSYHVQHPQQQHLMPSELPPYRSIPGDRSFGGGFPSNNVKSNQDVYNPPAADSGDSRSSNMMSDSSKRRHPRMNGLNRSWSIMHPDAYPPLEYEGNSGVPEISSKNKKRGPLNRSLSVSTEFVVERDLDGDIFNRHPRPNKPPPIERSHSIKKIPNNQYHRKDSELPLPTSLRPTPRKGTLNRSLSILDPEDPVQACRKKRGILNRSASMSTQQLAKASNALENERRVFEATFIKKMDEEDEPEIQAPPSSKTNSTFGNYHMDSGQEDHQPKPSSKRISGHRPKLRAQFSTEELDVRRVVSQSRNEKRYSVSNSGAYGTINV